MEVIEESLYENVFSDIHSSDSWSDVNKGSQGADRAFI